MSEHKLKGVRICAFDLPDYTRRQCGYYRLELLIPDDGSFGDNRHAFSALFDRLPNGIAAHTLDVTFHVPEPKPVWGSCVPLNEANEDANPQCDNGRAK